MRKMTEAPRTPPPTAPTAAPTTATTPPPPPPATTAGTTAETRVTEEQQQQQAPTPGGQDGGSDDIPVAPELDTSSFVFDDYENSYFELEKIPSSQSASDLSIETSSFDYYDDNDAEDVR